jgi:cobaltochelatase CobS
MPKTWNDINKIVNLKQDGRAFDVKKLETSFAKGDRPWQKDIINALRGENKDITGDVFPLGGLRLDLEMQRKRLENVFKKSPQDLINEIYTASVKMEKKKKRKESYTEVFEIPASVEKEVIAGAVMGADGEVKKTTTRKAVAPSIPKAKRLPKKSQKDQIVFTQLQSNPELSHYVPEIDENYEFPEFTAECAKFLDHGLNIWLHGGTGCGKSSLIEQICAIGKLPLMYCSFHEDVKPDQLFGGFRLVDGNTVWQDGPVTKAYREGLVLLLDEIDGLPPEIAFSLYAITDGKPLVLAENNNEVIQPHRNTRVVATGNTHGRGDESGMYSGTNVLNRAFLNRFRVWYKVEYPSRKVYKKIIENEGVSSEIAGTLATLAHEINSSFSNGTLTETFSLRDAREVAKITNILEGNVTQALKVTLMNRLSSIEQASVNEMFRRFVK